MTMKLATYGGLQAYVPAYACWWGQVIYLSLIGYRTAVRGIWAGMLDGRFVDYGETEYLRRIPNVPYHTAQVTLPDSGAVHFVMISAQATLSLERGQPFYVLKEKHEDGARVEQRFIQMLDRATGVPLLPQWGHILWQMGLAETLIEPCNDNDVLGIEAWSVNVHDAMWLDLIRQAITAGRLK